ncbi:Major facilitator superfamily (MFS) profile domain-containing protein [Entamoeba marina]
MANVIVCKMKQAVILYPKNFPKLKLIPLLLMLFIEALSQTSINSYVAYLLVDVGVAKDLDDAGNYNGFLITAFPIAQFFSSFIIGSLSDVIGRRPIMLIGTLGIGISNLLFGFSFSFYFIYAMRFINGLLNGNIGVVKTYMAELSDDSNRAQTFNLMGLMWAIGSVVGSFLGGILYNPTTNLSSIFGGIRIFETFPALLPQIADFMFSIITFIFAYLFLKENNINRNEQTNENKDDQDSSDSVEQEKKKNPVIKVLLSIKRTFVVMICFFGKRNIWSVYCSFIFFLLGFSNTTFFAIFPLLMIANVGNGGFGFDTAQVGYFSAISSVGGLICTIFFYQFIVRHLNLRLTFATAMFTSALFYGLFPCLEGFNGDSTFVRWIFVGGFGLLYQFCSQPTFATLNALIVNAADVNSMGAANGVAQSFISLSKIVGPLALSPLLSWCLTNDIGYPINQYFPFYILMISALLAAFMVCFTPRSINKIKVKKVVDNGSDSVSDGISDGVNDGVNDVEVELMVVDNGDVEVLDSKQIVSTLPLNETPTPTNKEDINEDINERSNEE